MGSDEIQTVFQGNLLSETELGPGRVIHLLEIPGDKGFWKVQALVVRKVCIRNSALTLTSYGPANDSPTFSRHQLLLDNGVKRHLAGSARDVISNGPCLTRGGCSLVAPHVWVQAVAGVDVSRDSVLAGAVLVAVGTECRTQEAPSTSQLPKNRRVPSHCV